jgi:hypothetical protein
MSTGKTITRIAAAAVFASLAVTFAGGSAQAGWGQNGMYGNAPQAQPGNAGYGGSGNAGRPFVVNPGQRPAWVPVRPNQVENYPRPMPQQNYPQQNYPRPAPPIYVPTPVVMKQPVYVPSPPVVVRQPVYVSTPAVARETVYVQRPAAPVVVASTPAPVVQTPVVNNTCNCLVKEYPQPGVVVFRDTCTKETASYSNLPQQTTAVVPPPVQ